MAKYLFALHDQSGELVEFVSADLDSDGDAVSYVFRNAWDPRFVDVMQDGRMVEFPRQQQEGS